MIRIISIDAEHYWKSIWSQYFIVDKATRILVKEKLLQTWSRCVHREGTETENYTIHYERVFSHITQL